MDTLSDGQRNGKGKGKKSRRHSEEKKQDEKEMVDDISLPKNRRKRLAMVGKSEKKASRSDAMTRDVNFLQTDRVGGLEPEGDLESTFHVKQSAIKDQVDLSAQAKSQFSLDLSSSNLSPYIRSSFSRSGRCLLMASRLGHVSVMNWRQLNLQCEDYMNETIRDATFLHDDNFFATAQKEAVFIYDAQSASQVHALRKHSNPSHLMSLPHHLLLASVSSWSSTAALNSRSQLVYTDTTTGNIVSTINLQKLGAPLCAGSNLANGVVHVGHHNGVVSLWSPLVQRPLARIFAHAGGVRHIAFLPSTALHNGRLSASANLLSNGPGAMVTTGADGMVKITDLRTFTTRTCWKLPAVPTALAVSVRGVIATSFGATVQTWVEATHPLSRNARLKTQSFNPRTSESILINQDSKSPSFASTAPYMSETFSGLRITSLDFCPYEDLLAVCHTQGMRMTMVPGCGEATFDSSVPNPYSTRKQRREATVRSLLDKLAPETIVLDPDSIGSVDQDPDKRLGEMRERESRANINQLRLKAKQARDRKRARGRGKISKRLRAKETNIVTAKHLEQQEENRQRQQILQRANQIRKKQNQAVQAGTAHGDLRDTTLPDALNRFLPKPKQE